MNQKANNIDDFVVKTYYEPINGIRMVISSCGLIDVNKKISQKAREEILKNISKSFENIPENWLIEGEYKNDNFYVLYIRNDKKEILDVDETIEWAKIFEFCSPPVKNKLCINGIEKFKNMEIRPRNKFDKLEMIKQFGNNGKEKNVNWRLKVKETFYEK